MPFIADATDYVQKKGVKVFANDPERRSVFRGVRCISDIDGNRIVIGLKNTP
jgi:hypothetical protein